MMELGLFFFLFPICFDYKSSFGSSSILQIVFTAICLMGAGLVITLPRPTIRKYSLKAINRQCLCGVGLLLLAIMSQVINENPLKDMARVFMLLLVFVLSALVVRKLALIGYDMSRFFNWLVIACLMAVLWRFVQGMSVIKAGLAEARSSITSPVLPFILAYGLSRVFLLGIADVIGGACTMLAGGIAILSITRSYLITIAAIGIGLSIVIFQQIRKNRNQSKLVGLYVQRIVMVGMVFALTLGAVIIVRPNTLEVWNRRLHQKEAIGTSVDITYLTRAAENQGMMDRMKDPSSYAFGKGLGAYYRWGLDYWTRLVPYLGTTYFVYPVNTASHNFWYYVFFSLGGGGLLLILINVCNPVVGWIRNQAISEKIQRNNLLEIIPFIATLAWLSLTYTSNPLGERFGALVFGATLALTCLNRPFDSRWSGIKRNK